MKVRAAEDVIQSFRDSEVYALKLEVKVAAKVRDTYFIMEAYLKANLDGDFDGFIEAFLAEEEKKL